MKYIYLQIDVSDIYGYKPLEENYNAKHHPHLTNTSMPLFYLSYLTVFPVKHMIQKIKINFSKNPPAYHEYDLKNTGRWYAPILENKIKADPEGYINSEPSFNVKEIRSGNMGTKIAQNITALKHIKKLADDHHIQLIAYIAPHHHQMLRTFHPDSYQQYLTEISKIMDYWDFSGFNSITLNNHYYYESSHYREDLANVVAKRIFNDTTGPQPPSDFGKWVASSAAFSSLKASNEN